MTRAMLLCAGKGTRLGPLSGELPKPMLPVCGIPILRYGIANLVGQGICDIVINLHHNGECIREELGDGTALGARIQYSFEPELLGTGGGLKKALPLLDPNGRDEPFISLNGKLIFDLEFAPLLEAFARQEDSLGVMVVAPVENALQWGAVDVEEHKENHYVRNILGKGGHMFRGVHVTRPSVVAKLPEGEACMVRQGYLPWIQGGAQVGAYEHPPGYFAEHSTPKRYLQSSIDLLRASTLRHPPGVLQGVDPSAQIDSSATLIEPLRIGPSARVGPEARVGPDVVVGQGASISAGTHIAESVVWNGAEASGTLHQQIVTPQVSIPARGADDVDCA